MVDITLIVGAILAFHLYRHLKAAIYGYPESPDQNIGLVQRRDEEV